MNRMKKRKGASLILVLAIMTVIVMVSGVTLSVILKTTKFNVAEKKSEDLLFSAESGLQYGIAWFKSNETVYDNSSSPLIINSASVKLVITEIETGKRYHVVSTAQRDSNIRSVAVDIVKIPVTLSDIFTAVYGKNSINLGGNSSITGDIETSALTTGAIYSNGSTSVAGDIILPPGGDASIVDLKNSPYPNIVVSSTYRNYPTPVLPDFPDKNTMTQKGTLIVDSNNNGGGKGKGGNSLDPIEGNTYYDKISVKGGILTINAPSGSDIKIRVGIFDMSGGSIVINGGGKVSLYADSCSGLGGEINKPGDKSILVLYVASAPGSSIKMTSSTYINGSLYLGKINLEMNAQSVVTGDIISAGTSLKMAGDPENYHIIYAPDADITFVGSTYVLGAVVGKTVDLSGTPGVQFPGGKDFMEFLIPVTTEVSSEYSLENLKY